MLPHRLVGQRLYYSQLHHPVRQQTQGLAVTPFRDRAAGQGDQVGFTPGVQLAGPVELGVVLQDPSQPILAEALLDPVHRAQRHIHLFCHLGRRLTVVALEQNPRPGGHPRRAFPNTDQTTEFLPLFPAPAAPRTWPSPSPPPSPATFPARQRNPIGRLIEHIL